MASLLTPAFVREAGLPEDADGQRAAIAEWHARKTAIYTEMVAGKALPARPGVTRLIGEALDAGWTLAVASTSAEPSDARCWSTWRGGKDAARLPVVLAGGSCAQEPAPDIYELALERPASPSDALVIEDSRNGLEAAVGAGLRCLVTVNGYTAEEDFDEAALVLTSLGDPGGERTRVLANRSQAEPGRAG